MRRLLRRHYGDDASLEPAPRRPAIATRFEAYFAGDVARARRPSPWRTAGTAFQREVWAALRAIPAGETLSYGELARADRQARRRCAPSGLANGANPVAVVVPCHRVIGANGSLTGYGGGLRRKRWLLAHEGARVTAE